MCPVCGKKASWTRTMDGEWLYCSPCYIEIHLYPSGNTYSTLSDESGKWLTGHKRPKTGLKHTTHKPKPLIEEY